MKTDFQKKGGPVSRVLFPAEETAFPFGNPIHRDRAAAIHLVPESPPESSDLPANCTIGCLPDRPKAYPETARWRGASNPSLLGLARDEACHAGTVASSAVGSYPTFSPLPRNVRGLRPCHRVRRFVFCGALCPRNPPWLPFGDRSDPKPGCYPASHSIEPGLSSPRPSPDAKRRHGPPITTLCNQFSESSIGESLSSSSESSS